MRASTKHKTRWGQTYRTQCYRTRTRVEDVLGGRLTVLCFYRTRVEDVLGVDLPYSMLPFALEEFQ